MLSSQIPTINSQPIPTMYRDENLGINFNVDSVASAVVFRKAEYLFNGVLKTEGAHVPVYDALEKKINWNQVVKQAEGGWYVTIGWAVTKNASHLDECIFFGRKNGTEIKWYLAVSHHNFVAWLSEKMCDLIIAVGLKEAGLDDSSGNRSTLGKVIESSILSFAYLNGNNSVEGFSLGKELRELVKEHQLKTIAIEKKTRKKNLDGEGESYDILRAWDPLGSSKITRSNENEKK